MSGIRYFTIHRCWEDWVGMLIGVLIWISPWFAEQQGDQAVIWNAILVGTCVRSCAARIRQPATLGGNGEIALGLWLIASPFKFGYAEADTLRYWHFILGAIVVLLGALELWQDWS